MIMIDDRAYRTLEDVIKLDGQVVNKVTVDGNLVYPEPTKVRKREWGKNYWLRVSGKTRLYYVRRKRNVNNRYSVPSPDIVWRTSRCSALFNSNTPMPVLQGAIVSPTISYDMYWDGYSRLPRGRVDTYEGNMKKDMETLAVCPLGDCTCELAIETEGNWPVTHTQVSTNGVTHTSRFDSSFSDKCLVRVVIDRLNSEYRRAIDRSGSTDLKIGAAGHMGTTDIYAWWPYLYAGPMTGVSVIAEEVLESVNGTSRTSGYAIPVAENPLFEFGYTTRTLGYSSFDTVEYVNYDIDEANANYANRDIEPLPFVIPPDDECKVGF